MASRTDLRGDDLLNSEEPCSPLGLGNSDPPEVLDLDSMKWVVSRQPNGDLHRLLVNDVAGGDLVHGREDLDRQRLVLERREGVRVAERRKLMVDDDR